ncbi:DUF2484 family protein [Gymnodinialimonas hymeniacidonis]|uniref:DUF2484 family protein n=1 Tax=Gymnodinialimonas hymeniacidonis TaxID=3126508 RepID=UPI0034C6AA0C
MPVSLILACIWALIACAAGMGPRRFHIPAAWVLILTGIPLLGFVTYQTGPFWGIVLLLAGASVLRWPLIRHGQRIRRALYAAQAEDEAG